MVLNPGRGPGQSACILVSSAGARMVRGLLGGRSWSGGRLKGPDRRRRGLGRLAARDHRAVVRTHLERLGPRRLDNVLRAFACPFRGLGLRARPKWKRMAPPVRRTVPGSVAIVLATTSGDETSCRCLGSRPCLVIDAFAVPVESLVAISAGLGGGIGAPPANGASAESEAEGTCVASGVSSRGGALKTPSAGSVTAAGRRRAVSRRLRSPGCITSRR